MNSEGQISLHNHPILSGRLAIAILNPFMDSSTTTHWTSLFPIEEVSDWFLLLPCFTEIPVINANSVNPDQMLHSAASNLGLRCMPDTLSGDSGLKWVEWICPNFRISMLTCPPS